MLALCVITPAALGPQYFREVAEASMVRTNTPADITRPNIQGRLKTEAEEVLLASMKDPSYRYESNPGSYNLERKDATYEGDAH
jgi:hypothetical protein